MTDVPSRGPAPSPFREFIDRDWERWMSDLPEVATVVGARGQDDRWTDDSPSGIEARHRHLEETHRGLERFRADELAPSERLDFRLYHEMVEEARAGLVYGHDPCPFRFGAPRSLWLPISQVDGIHLSAPDLLLLQPRGSVEQYSAVLDRFRRLAGAIDQQIRLLSEGLRAGWSQPRVPLREVANQIAALVREEPTESAVFRPFVEFPPSIPEAERGRIAREAGAVYTESVAPAFERLRRFVTDTYLPACREEVGASTLPHGADWYRFLVAYHTTTRLSPREIHDTGLSEVRRLRGEMEKVRLEAGFAGSLEEFKQHLRTDPRFFPTSKEGMLTAYRSLAKQIDPELARQFGRLPRMPYGVVPVPEYRSASSPAAYYLSGSTRTGRPGQFFVNTFDLAARPTWEMEALTMHEAVPGHHLQLALADEVVDVPAFRRHSGPTAFVEGWGLYAESLGADLGFYRDPYARFGQLSMDAWRSARLVVDTGLHAMGWSRQQAIDYLLEATGKSLTDIVAEVDRYIVWPGQALAYKVGQLRLRAARERAAGRLGPRFDVRSFHDMVLAEGALPLGAVDERVDRWVDGLSRA